MKGLLTSAALVFVGTAVMRGADGKRHARAVGDARPGAVGRTRRFASGDAAAEAAKHRAWLNKNCVGCHNSRTKSPPEAPVNLESASLDDLLPQAETWERVLRKLGARAMPPQGVPHPAEGEYVGFTTWLAGSLDRAWEGRSTPGRYVMHRLNRSEYANAVRDLLALDIDVTDWLPSDGANFGFDNIAASLRTSPLLLERYVATAQRISAMAVGDPTARPGTTEYLISREFSQSGHIDSLPLGTRGGTMVRHVFPADAEYKLSGRLVRGVEEGYAGVEGNDTPHTFIITIDGAEVYSAQVGGPKDHEIQARDMNEAKVLIDARMTGRVAVTAGPHEVGFTWKERPVAAAGCVAARTARQPGSPYGCRHAAAAGGERRGPLQRERDQQHAEPRTAVRLPPGVSRRGAGVRRKDPDESGAARLPASGHGRRRRGADRLLQAGARERRRLRRRHPLRRRADPVQPVVPVSDRARSGRRPGRRGTPDQRPGARVAPVVLPLEQHPRPEAAGSGRGGPAPRAGDAGRPGAPHDRGRARRCAGQQLHRPVAAAAQPGVEGRAGPAALPGFRRQHPEGVPPRDRVVLRTTSCARTGARWSC